MGERVLLVRWVGAYGSADPYAAAHYEARGCRGGRPRAAALQDADRLEPVGDARVGILLDPRRTRILAAHAGDAWTVYRRAGRRFGLRATRSWSYGRGFEGLMRAAHDLGDRAYSEVVVRRMVPVAVLAVPGGEETAEILAAAIQAEVGRQVPVIVGWPASWLAHRVVAGASVRLGPGRPAGGTAPRQSGGTACAGAGANRRPRGRRYCFRAVLVARGQDGSPIGARVRIAPGLEFGFWLMAGEVPRVQVWVGTATRTFESGMFGPIRLLERYDLPADEDWRIETGVVARVARWALRTALVFQLESAAEARSALGSLRCRGFGRALVSAAAAWAVATIWAWATPPFAKKGRRALEDSGWWRLADGVFDLGVAAAVAGRLPAVGQAGLYEVDD